MGTNQLTRLRRAFTAVSPTDSPRADRPPAERIWEGVHGESGPGELRELIHHVAGRPLCTEAWRLAAKLERSAEESSEEDTLPRPRSFPWRHGLRGAAAAAAAAVVLTLGLQLGDGTDRPPAFRTPDSQKIELSSQGPLPRDDFLLRWLGPEDAVYYDLRVSSVAEPWRTLAEVSELDVPEYRIPPEALAELPSGTELQVHLEALHPIEGRMDADTFSVAVR